MAAPDYLQGSNPFDPQDDFPSTAVAVTLPIGVDAVEADYSYSVEATHETIVNTSWGGKEKRTAKAPVRRIFKILFDQLTPAAADALWGHFLAQEGRLYNFDYYEYLSDVAYDCRYNMDSMDRETFLYEAEKVGLELIEVL
jgi:hypothetical protein